MSCWLLRCYKSSRPEVFYKKGVLRNFAKFTGKHLCQSLFFNKVAGLRPATLLKKRLWYRCFSVNFAKFLGTSFLTKHLQWCYNTNPFASPLPHDFYVAIIEEKVYQTFSFSMSGWKQLLSLYSPLKTIDSKL